MGKMKKILVYLMITLCLCEVAQNQANAVEVVQEVIRYDDGSYSVATRATTTCNIVRNGWVKKSDNHYCSENKAYATGKFSNSSGTRTASLTLTCSSTGKI